MRIASGQRKPLSLPWRLLTALALLCATPQSVLAETDQPKAMPPCVARVLRWLPEDTETLVDARSVTLPGPDGGQDWQDRAVGLACEDVFLSREKKLEDLFAKLDPVQGRKIECMVRGARNFEGVSSFGSLRSESCTIIVFEKELGGDGAKWTESLRKGSKAVQRLVGREVFVYPSATVMEPWVKETEWQGTYFVLSSPGSCSGKQRSLPRNDATTCKRPSQDSCTSQQPAGVETGRLQRAGLEASAHSQGRRGDPCCGIDGHVPEERVPRRVHSKNGQAPERRSNQARMASRQIV